MIAHLWCLHNNNSCAPLDAPFKLFSKGVEFQSCFQNVQVGLANLRSAQFLYVIPFVHLPGANNLHLL